MKLSSPQTGRLMVGAALLAALLSPASQAQVAEPAPAPEGLKGVPVPEPGDLSTYVANRAAAIRLGKALFWDMQLGSDGKTACASCHFQAGADPRARNQVSPGLLRVNPDKSPNPDTSFQVGGPNHRPQAFGLSLPQVPGPAQSQLGRANQQ
jgi:cytochrome c peroxidase